MGNIPSWSGGGSTMNATAFIRRSRMSMYPYEEARWIGVLPSDDYKRTIANQSALARNIHCNGQIELDVQYTLIGYRKKSILVMRLFRNP